MPPSPKYIGSQFLKSAYRALAVSKTTTITRRLHLLATKPTINNKTEDFIRNLNKVQRSSSYFHK